MHNLEMENINDECLLECKNGLIYQPNVDDDNFETFSFYDYYLICSNKSTIYNLDDYKDSIPLNPLNNSWPHKFRVLFL